MNKALTKNFAALGCVVAAALSLTMVLFLAGSADAAPSEVTDAAGLVSATPPPHFPPPPPVLPPTVPSTHDCRGLKVDLPDDSFEVGKSVDVVVTFGGCIERVNWGAPEYRLSMGGVLDATQVQSFVGAVESATFTVTPRSPGVGSISASITYDRDFFGFDGSVIPGSASTKSATALVGVAASSLLADLNLAEETWTARNRNGGTYHLSYEIFCFCLEQPKYYVTVEDGVVTRAVASNGQDVTDFGLRTVPQMFDEIREAISTAHSVSALFDPATGVPRSYSIDQVAMIADEEFEVRVTSYLQGPFLPTDEEHQRQLAVNEMLEALESYHDANGSLLVAGGGAAGRGQGWAFFERGDTNYPVSTARLLMEEGHLASDPAHDDLWKGTHSIAGDVLIYQCKDRVGVFTREGNGAPSFDDAAWWTENDCNRYPIDRLNAQYFQLSKASTAEAERQSAVDQLVDALESYGAANGTYVVRGGGSRGNGQGWALYEDADFGYPVATARVLTEAGHLPANAGAPRDPLWTDTGSISGDMLVYGCKDRVAVFTREGDGVPSFDDAAWWTENECNPYPTERLNAKYFKVSDPL